MRLTTHVRLLLGLGFCLLAASRLNGQVGGSVPGDPSRSAAPRVGDNRPGSVEQPRFRLEDYKPGVRSPADELHDFMRGGTMPPPQAGSYADPPSFKPTEIHFPPPKIQFRPPADHSGDIGAIFSIAGPLGIVLATIMIGLARRRQEQASHGPGNAFSRAGPESTGHVHRDRCFIKLGADGKGGIMYRDDG
jgi:hypothetical protein